MRLIFGAAGSGLICGLVLAGCSPAPAPRSSAHPAAPAPPAPSAALQAINAAGPPANLGSASAGAAGPVAPDPAIVRLEVLLDRARFSPGVIDGLGGTNLRNAVAAYEARAGLAAGDALDPAAWAALTRAAAPAAATYVITPQDVAGPFAPDVGEDFVKMAALPGGPLYSSPLEALAERFHMSPGLLAALNPGADFSKPGARLTVAATGAAAFAKGDVKRIEVSKGHAQVTAFGADGAVLAVYPATVGSTERPSPSGMHKIRGVAWNTDYVYDPAKLDWGPRSHGRFRIKPGPKGPVGVVWIDLNAPGYGIHGTPDASKIGKTASHGCVRLTNWDAWALARGVRPGVVVAFVGERGGEAR